MDFPSKMFGQQLKHILDYIAKIKQHTVQGSMYSILTYVVLMHYNKYCKQQYWITLFTNKNSSISSVICGFNIFLQHGCVEYTDESNYVVENYYPKVEAIYLIKGNYLQRIQP